MAPLPTSNPSKERDQMSSQARNQIPRVLRVVISAALALAALAAAHAAPASAAQYRMLLCAGNVGSNAFGTNTNTASPQNPNGIFVMENHCGQAPDPAGDSAFLRIAENQSAGNAGPGAFG